MQWNTFIIHLVNKQKNHVSHFKKSDLLVVADKIQWTIFTKKWNGMRQKCGKRKLKENKEKEREKKKILRKKNNNRPFILFT